jgi:hypothetical protein
MTLEGMGALPDMLDVAVEAESHVQRLQVCIKAPLPDGFVARIARGSFRTNTTMTALALSDAANVWPTERAGIGLPIVELLETYNCTVDEIRLARNGAGGGVEETIDKLLRRNRRIRRALDRLDPKSTYVAPPNRLPEGLGLLSSFPTLLHRFLRQGDVDASVNCLVLRGGHPGNEVTGQ